MALTAVSMVPWPLIITTGSSGSMPLTASSISSPSSPPPCIQMSCTRSEGRRARKAASAPPESAAVRTA